MDGPLLAAALILLLFLPFHLLVCWQLWKMNAPARGDAPPAKAEVDARGEVIGRYSGDDIHAWISVAGRCYRFDRVQPAARAGNGELVLPPGLIYVLAPEPG